MYLLFIFIVKVININLLLNIKELFKKEFSSYLILKHKILY